MILHDIVMRVRGPRQVRAERGTVRRAAGLLAAAAVLILAGASCGPATAEGNQIPTVRAMRSPVTPATTVVATRTSVPALTTPTTTPSTVAASLLTRLLADPRSAAANGVVTYSIIIMNDMLGGADPGAAVMVTSQIPAHTTYVSGSANNGATYDTAGRITWAGVVTRGLSTAISFQVRVNADTPSGGQLEIVALITDALGRTATARASVSVIAPLPGATPPAIAVQPAGARTNVKDVDLIIDAVMANDVEARRKLIAYLITPCTTAQGMGGPPKCAPGEANGTAVEVFPFLGEEGEHVRRAGIDRILQFTVQGLYGVYRVPDSAFRAAYWPAGTYALVFLATGLQRQATVFVDNGKIVRIELSRQERWPSKDTPGLEWLLPPVSSP